MLDVLKPSSEESYLPQLNLFFVIDTSASMEGGKIMAINDVMRELMAIVDRISEGNKDNVVIKVSVLSFNEKAEWMFPESVYASDMQVGMPVFCASGKTYIGVMCDALESALHRDKSVYPLAQLKSNVQHKAPVIILMLGGKPLDDDWEIHIEVLKKNSWFNGAFRMAIAVGIECDINVLKAFVGTEANIYTSPNVGWVCAMEDFLLRSIRGHWYRLPNRLDFDDFD